jgi:hypothetical protein
MCNQKLKDKGKISNLKYLVTHLRITRLMSNRFCTAIITFKNSIEIDFYIRNTLILICVARV